MGAIRPNPGPQTDFFGSDADVVIYGGGAGGGKSFALLAEPTRWSHVPGFYAGIFRRTSKQIKDPGGLFDEASVLYPPLGGKMRGGSQIDAIWESGAKVAFCQCQHEATKYEYQGSQFCYLGFDELTHFTKTQWLYILGRNRSKCGVRPYCRCTCNPDASSWVAEFIEWWIDPETGLAIPERSGVKRYWVHHDDRFVWADSEDEIREMFPGQYDGEFDILSATFISASVFDNPKLLEKDPGYVARLKSQPKIERQRLLECNWLASEGSIIDKAWIRRYSLTGNGIVQLNYQGMHLELPLHPAKNQPGFRTFATIDTAGTSKEKAAEARGDPPSWSVCAIWGYLKWRDNLRHYDILILRHVWRDRVDWNGLKARIPEVLSNWSVPLVVIENAHYGQPLASELKGFNTRLVGPKIPGMDDTSRGAKLERAIASGFLSRLEDIGIWIPENDFADWVPTYVREMTAWTGLPKETSDQIDASSWAAWHVKTTSSGWGGVL